MNKFLSQAIRKAVFEYNPNTIESNSDKRPDLFSLSNETELFQNEKGIIIKIDRARDKNLTDFGKATLKDRYLGLNESFQDLFARVASTYADNNLHAQRLYNYISNLWFISSYLCCKSFSFAGISCARIPFYSVYYSHLFWRTTSSDWNHW